MDHTGTHGIYRPAFAIDCVTAQQALGRLPITLLTEPDEVCGIAKRIGYTGKDRNDLALYRLKLKEKGKREYITLPSLFVVDGGIFQEYECWLAQREQHDNAAPAQDDEHIYLSP